MHFLGCGTAQVGSWYAPPTPATVLKEEFVMFAHSLYRLRAVAQAAAQVLRRNLLAATRPVTAPLIVGTLIDLVRTKPALIVENALLRQQLIILRRSVKRPRCTTADRALLVLLASRVRTWRQSLLIVQPDTLLRWHRALFRRFWRRKSRATAPAHRPPIAPETIALIREWLQPTGRGALNASGVNYSSSDPGGQVDHPEVPARRPPTATRWPELGHLPAQPRAQHLGLRLPAGHRPAVPLDRCLRRDGPGHTQDQYMSGVTRHPTDAWVTQQLREATPFCQHPKHLIRDNDSRFGPAFRALAAATGIEDVRTAYRAPKENACCERYWGACAASVWTTCSSSTSSICSGCCASTPTSTTLRDRTGVAAT